MELPVLIEANATGGFTAKLGFPFDLKVEASTVEAAMDGLRTKVKTEVESGRQIQTLQVETDVHSLQKWAGTWDDPAMLELYRSAMADYRSQKDQADGIELNDAPVHH